MLNEKKKTGKKPATARARRHRIFIIVGIIACIAAAVAVVRLAFSVHQTAEEKAAAEQKQEQIIERRRRAARNRKKAYVIDSKMERVASKYVGNKGGKRFWSWYGFTSHQPWCGCFASYCASKSGKLGKTVPKFAYVPDGVNWYKQHGRWEKSSYKPKSGDLIFFRFKGDGNAGSHVGIVAGVEGGRVYTIEGNRKNRCVKRDYDLDAHVILGYGRT
jgi:hypothetical protein